MGDEMQLSNERAGMVSSAIFMIGIGVLFYTGYWWPGIMFVIGAAAIIQGLVSGHGWYSFQAGVWTIGMGVWAILNYNIAIMFVVLGVSMLYSAIFKPPFLKKPYVDNSLE